MEAEMPKPSAEHEKLARLAGVWKGTENMHPSEWCPEGSTADGVNTSRVALGGFCVVNDYEQTVGGKTMFSGHGIYTVDPQNNDVVMHWFDSMAGQREEFRGKWEGDILTLTSKNPMMGTMRMTYAFQADGSLASAMDCSQDGQDWKRMFDCIYRRES